ncbi:acyl-CoA synthetase [Morganella psychrotolerans]|uniref:Acyl-CoA synthetase n=1 Tax=Morganella psychrotolerans TaxID=368603 RepID=A0A5M9R302_9GAMM|nr:acyl-CoA synthetase [Morganella psychrotolerans]KAA8714911.1 acyl-CoA synthetase [Morganella psychrotolerans]
MMTDEIRQRISAVKAWLSDPQTRKLLFSADPATQSFCQLRLQWLADSNALEHQAEKDLGLAPWLAPEQILIIDDGCNPLSTLDTFLTACLTGSAIRIKTRHHREWLITLCRHLDPGNTRYDVVCPGLSDAALLRGTDTVIPAGDDALIRHWRTITPSYIRLIESAPKISAMAICGADLPAPELILWDTCLFSQQVNSSPRFILLDSPMIAERLYLSLVQLLDELPRLPESVRLLQMAKSKELTLRHILTPPLKPAAYSPGSGWGITLQRTFDPDQFLPYGFNLIAGDTQENLKRAAKHWPGQLETLSYHGRTDLPAIKASRFTRHCAAGQMHNHPLCLSSTVTFIADDNRAKTTA